MTQLLRLTKSPMCANTQQSTDMMELSGLALQVSHFRTMPLNSPKRMEQRRKSMLTNLRQPLKVARATENHARLVSEWTIKSTCSFNTTLHPKIQCILPEKVVVVHALQNQDSSHHRCVAQGDFNVKRPTPEPGRLQWEHWENFWVLEGTRILTYLQLNQLKDLSNN